MYRELERKVPTLGFGSCLGLVGPRVWGVWEGSLGLVLWDLENLQHLRKGICGFFCRIWRSLGLVLGDLEEFGVHSVGFGEGKEFRFFHQDLGKEFGVGSVGFGGGVWGSFFGIWGSLGLVLQDLGKGESLGFFSARFGEGSLGLAPKVWEPICKPSS